MSLDKIIPAEISGDAFFSALVSISQRKDLRFFLEIGSSSGLGSTTAICSGISSRVDAQQTRLFCLEVSKQRYCDLVNNLRAYPFVVPYNLSSVPLDSFPSEEEVRHFLQVTKTNLNLAPVETVLEWLNQDTQYIKDNGLNYCGLDFVKIANGIESFDFVLIDGSEFTGERELRLVMGAKIIALDDVNSFKCFSAYQIMRTHFSYKLVAQDLSLRNGFAIFEKNY